MHPTPSGPPTPHHTGLSRQLWMLILVLMSITLLFRNLGLMSLPLFGDEGIYLRWAQLIRQNFLNHAFVSLVDPKPPLHYWLLAAFWGLTRDPLLSGRIISVLTGVILIPGVVLLCRELELWYLQRVKPAQCKIADPAGTSGLLAALLFTFCPFLAFYQRLALADSLLVMEIVFCTWLSLRFARTISRFTPTRYFWTCTFPLGLTMGLTMLSRQIISYELWALPIIAFIAGDYFRHPANYFSRINTPLIASFIRRFIVAFFIGLAVWSPFLLASPERYHPDGIASSPITSQSFKDEFRRRVLYQPQFTQSKTLAQRFHLITQNIKLVAIPTFTVDKQSYLGVWANSQQGDLATGWYWVYLTPTVFIASLLSFFYLLWKRLWGWFLFLAGWEFLMVGPFILVGEVGFSRYTLAGVPPLLISLGLVSTQFLNACLLSKIQDAKTLKKRSFLRPLLAAGFTLLLLAWPIYEIHFQNTQWQHQSFVKSDRSQYQTGWTAGQATMRAIRFLQQGFGANSSPATSTAPTTLPAALTPYHGPMIVITSDAWGNPSDAIQVYLRQRPETQVYYVDWMGREPILRSLGDDTYRIRTEKWLYLPEQNITYPPNVPVFFVCADPIYTREGPALSAFDVIKKYDTLIDGPWYTENPSSPYQPNGPSSDRVMIVRLR